MEKILIAVLLALLALLLYVLSLAKNNTPPDKMQKDPLPGAPDILGRPKLGGRPPVPTQAIEIQNGKIAQLTFNLEDENKRDAKPAIPQEGPDEESIPGWEEEEEEMKGYAIYPAHDKEFGLATGVTYDELAAVGVLLQQETLQSAEKSRTVSLASKIDGTELLDLLESAVGDASKRIAKLLDQSDDHGSDSGSSFLRNNDEDDFNIGDYV